MTEPERKNEAKEALLVSCPKVGTEVIRVACMYCPYGHMLECHYPLTCDEAECDHYKAEMEEEEGD